MPAPTPTPAQSPGLSCGVGGQGEPVASHLGQPVPATLVDEDPLWLQGYLSPQSPGAPGHA